MKKRTRTARLFCLLAVLALCLARGNVSLAAETKTDPTFVKEHLA